MQIFSNIRFIEGLSIPCAGSHQGEAVPGVVEHFDLDPH